MSATERNASDRTELKKFQDLKTPLSMLRVRMQMKSEENESYKVFANEIENICNEQGSFLGAFEVELAKADALDKVQASQPPTS